MKILYLLDSLNRGGTETLVWDICRNARRHGFDLTFVAAGGGRMEEDFERDAPRLVRLKRRLPLDLNVVWRLRRIIKTGDVQILHAHQAVEGLHGYLAALGTNCKVVLSFHGFVGDAKNRRTLEFLIPRTAKNVYVSEALRQWYKTEIGLDVNRNFAVLHNGVDAQRLKPTNKDLREELKIAPAAKVFGMIGNFYVQPRKDQLTLIKALPRVFARVENAVCLVVGRIEAGAEAKFAECVKSARENGIFENVRFLGARADVPDILNLLDVFVLSSLHEGLPIAVLEAMLAGVPCVLSDIAPNTEVSGDGEFARVFETGNSEMLAEKLIELLENDAERETLAARALKFAENNYSIAAHLEKIKNLYQDLI